MSATSSNTSLTTEDQDNAARAFKRPRLSEIDQGHFSIIRGTHSSIKVHRDLATFFLPTFRKALPSDGPPFVMKLDASPSALSNFMDYVYGGVSSTQPGDMSQAAWDLGLVQTFDLAAKYKVPWLEQAVIDVLYSHYSTSTTFRVPSYDAIAAVHNDRICYEPWKQVPPLARLFIDIFASKNPEDVDKYDTRLSCDSAARASVPTSFFVKVGERRAELERTPDGGSRVMPDKRH